MNQENHKHVEHKDGGDRQGGHQHGKGHGLMMLLCCVAMMGGFVLLRNLGGAFGYLALLLCPLMHIFMMKGMSHKK